MANQVEPLKIGILGGTFNPIHVGHLMIAEQVRDFFSLDRFLFMPSATPPHKKEKKTIDSVHRQEMVRLAIQNHPCFDLETYEIENGGVNYTYNTIQALKEKYPNAIFYFVIGADMVEDLPNWYRIDDLVQEVHFIGINRVSASLETPYPISILKLPFIEISSTMIRKHVNMKKSITYYVPESVENYIMKHKLYVENEEFMHVE
ncbi:nicotinate-nucleotide adenylyltransferase [Carnobacteriaceae bacterium zg-ZUI78]|nr:nicotinate-nucleotide adenylyltransferase [Carnobacteriaceae bacterium zg-ZUI78]